MTAYSDHGDFAMRHQAGGRKEGMESREAMERAGKAQEVSEGHEHFGRRAAVVIACIAALLAIASIAGSRATTETILAQNKATDTYNEYQANSLKRQINEATAATLRILGAGGPAQAAAEKQAADLDQTVATKYRPNQDRLLP